VRAIAVLIVFVGHGFTAPLLWPGHTGVTIFFFLSGYLITTLLRRERDATTRISLSKFYLRRALRILPPAYITIVFAVVVGAFGLLHASTTVGGVLAELLNVTNYYMIFFGREGLPPETSMLWSLSVEEHFYLIFPAVFIALMWRRMTYRRIGYVLLVVCAITPLWRLLLWVVTQGDFLRLYVASDTRFDGLLAGAAMALLFNPALGERAPFRLSDKTIRFILAPIAVTAFALSAIAPDIVKLTVADTVQYVALFVLFWVVIRHPAGVVGRILNSKVMVRIGLLSFSIYLLHRLVLALLGPLLPVDPLRDLVSLIATILVAQLMYVTVEKPLGRVRRRLESHLSKRPAVASGADQK
jgi:peptidoglycan/LPS O-acetylase OafA/YrhL